MTSAEIIKHAACITSLARILAGEEKMNSLLRRVAVAAKRHMEHPCEGPGNLRRVLETAGYSLEEATNDPISQDLIPLCRHSKPIGEPCELCVDEIEDF